MGSREDPYEKWRCPRKAALAKAGRGRPGAGERTPRERGGSAGESAGGGKEGGASGEWRGGGPSAVRHAAPAARDCDGGGLLGGVEQAAVGPEQEPFSVLSP